MPGPIKKALAFRILNIIARLNDEKKANERPKRIILLRFGHLGDVLQTTPVIKALARRWPKAQLDYLVAETSAAALKNNPYLNGIIIANHINGQRHATANLFGTISALRKRRYDLSISLGTDPLYGLIPLLAGIKNRIGLASDTQVGRLYNVFLLVTPESREPRQTAYGMLMQRAGIEVEDRSLDLRWTDVDEKAISSMLGGGRKGYIAMFAGGGENAYRPWVERRWPESKWTGLISRLARQYPGYSMVLLGSEKERERNSSIASKAVCSQLIDLTGKTTFVQLGALLKRCDLLISNDSSPVFAAAAVGCPVVAIIGPEWPERSRPLGALWHQVFVDIECRDDCVRTGAEPRKCGNECIKRVEVESVMEKAIQILKS